jgi:hypothetical protein
VECEDALVVVVMGSECFGIGWHGLCDLVDVTFVLGMIMTF